MNNTLKLKLFCEMNNINQNNFKSELKKYGIESPYQYMDALEKLNKDREKILDNIVSILGMVPGEEVTERVKEKFLFHDIGGKYQGFIKESNELIGIEAYSIAELMLETVVEGGVITYKYDHVINLTKIENVKPLIAKIIDVELHIIELEKEEEVELRKRLGGDGEVETHPKELEAKEDTGSKTTCSCGHEGKERHECCGNCTCSEK